MTVIAALRDYLAAEGLVRAPDAAGAGARPWLAPAWKHPSGGAIAPGDQRDKGAPETTWDDGLVVSLMHAPGIPPAPGAEERRIDGTDIVFRGTSVPAIVALEAGIRERLLLPDPGGRTDWVMAGLYVIQSSQWRPFQPVSAVDDVFTFSTGYLFETRAS